MAEQSQQQPGKLPIPALPLTEQQAERIKILQEKKAAAEEKMAATKEKCAVQKKSQNKARICIGEAFERWRKLKEEKGLRSDAQVAVFLLDQNDQMDSIATVDSCVQGEPQQAVTSAGHTDDPEGSEYATITEIIGFSDEENVPSDAEKNNSSDEGGGGDTEEGTQDHSSDSDWTPDDTTVGSENEEEEDDDSSVECGGKRRGWSEEHDRDGGPPEHDRDGGPPEHDRDGGPPEHDSINSISVTGEQPPEQAEPWCDTQSFSDSGENFDKCGAVGRKLRKLCPAVGRKLRKVCPAVGRKRRKLCPECGLFFKLLKPHTCEHKIKPFFCNQCGKRFATERNVKNHNRIHKESYKYVCRYCLATFKTKPNKMKHEGSHPPALKPYYCSYCPETFKTFLERGEHIQKSHWALRADRVCHICDMRFDNPRKLQRHSVVHTGEKHHVCKVCQRSFNQLGHLKSHMRVHTGEKPYQCQHCDESFNHNVSLKSHIQRYHQGQVPHPAMEAQTKKTNGTESPAELDDMSEMENSGLNNNNEEEEAERNNDTCNSGEKEDEEQGVAKKWNDTSTGKGNSRSGRAVITSGDQLKRTLCDGDATEECHEGSGDSASDSADEGEKRRSKKMRETTWRSEGRPKNSEGEEHSSHSEVDLEGEEHSSHSEVDLEGEEHSGHSEDDLL